MLNIMVGTPKEVARRFEEQTQVQQGQHEMFQAQQESINGLKKMMTLFLDKKQKKTKSSKTKASSRKSKDKKKEVRTLPLNPLTAMRTTSSMKTFSLLQKNQRIQKPKIVISR